MNHTDRKVHTLLLCGPVTGHDIAYALTLKGYTQREVADQIGVSFQLVHDVIYAKNTSYNVASTIAALLSQPLNRLWPDGRYDRAPRDAARKVSAA